MRCSRAPRYLYTSLKAEINSAIVEGIKNDAKIVVIGAGLAGLSAANHLINNGFHRTVVLEATERFGGRVDTKRFGDTYCELGAKWVNIDPSQDSIYELLQQANGLQKRIKQKQEIAYVDTNGRKLNKVMPELVDMLFRKLCRGFKMEDKYKTDDLQRLDNVMVYFKAESEQLIKSIFRKEEQAIANDIFNTLFKEFGSVLGCCLEYVNIEHITKVPLQGETAPIYIPTGLDNLLHQVSDNVIPTNICCGKPVGQIQWETGGGLAEMLGKAKTPSEKTVGCIDGSLFKADHIICTLPLGVLKNFSNLMFQPSLPKEKLDAINNLGFGNPVKIYFEYRRPIDKWFKVNLRPLHPPVKDGKRFWTNNVVEISKLPTSERVLELQIGGGYFDEIEKLPDVQVLSDVTQMIKDCLKDNSIPYPISILRSNWSSSACYLGGRPYFSTKSTAKDVSMLAQPLGENAPSLLFAGDATILNGFGTLDGARLSGIREAQRIINYYNRQSWI